MLECIVKYDSLVHLTLSYLHEGRPLKELVPHTKSEGSPTGSLHQAMTEAQQLAFAPVSFMTAYCLKRMGILEGLFASLSEGLTPAALAARCDVSPYAVDLLLESGLAIGAVQQRGEHFHLTKLGHVLHRDKMTDINFEFIYQVCYRGLFQLEDSLRSGQPHGLPSISDAATVYEGLHKLLPPARDAWLAFDHYYSDSAFTAALPHVLGADVDRLLDIGGNTGRFAKTCLAYKKDLVVTICDLPQQIEMAKTYLADLPERNRLSFHSCDLLAAEADLPPSYAAVWMSQFLVCFDEASIVRILRKAGQSLKPGGRIYILDTFWDRQKDPVSAFCLIQTSPYFTSIANGCSKIYRSDTLVKLAKEADLSVQDIIDDLGISHSLLILSRTSRQECI